MELASEDGGGGREREGELFQGAQNNKATPPNRPLRLPSTEYTPPPLPPLPSHVTRPARSLKSSITLRLRF